LLRIEQMVTVIARAAVTDLLGEILSDPKLRLIYENAGKVSPSQLEKRSKFSAGKISGLWKQWEMKGVMVKAGKSYRPLF